MTTDLAVYTPTISLGDQMDFAKAVVVRPEGSARSLLPESYRDNPANVLLAVGLGQSMGLSPAESLYRIDVIQGKPCASAELIAANVRKAGHKLRVAIDDQAGSVTATIVRADDPDYPFTVVRDMAWAQRMGLHTKDNYKKQPLTMLQWRAISGVARLACPEALYGVQYTPDEMYDVPRTGEQRSGGLADALADTVTVEQIPNAGDSEGSPAETSVAEGEAGSSPAGNPSESPYLNTSGGLAKTMFGLMGDLGITIREDRLDFVSDVLGRRIESSREMTDVDAEKVIAFAEERLTAVRAAEEGAGA